jgi:hypothetical protein
MNFEDSNLVVWFLPIPYIFASCTVRSPETPSRKGSPQSADDIARGVYIEFFLPEGCVSAVV